MLMKQQAIFFIPFAIGYAAWIELRANPRRAADVLRRGGFIAAGAAVPFVLLCVTLAVQGVLGRFWYWTFQYARAYVSEMPLSGAWQSFRVGLSGVTQMDRALWILGACGAALVWLVRWRLETRVFLTALLIASLLALAPGFYFRNHYFVLLLPVVALLIGVTFASARRLLEKALPHAVAGAIAGGAFGAVVAAHVVREGEYLVVVPAGDVSKQIYGANPFVEAQEVAAYIKARTSPEDRIAVLGSEPEIYFYANRKSATGFIYTYPLMENQPYARQMRAEMIHEVESAHAKYVVFVSIPTSWLDQGLAADFFSWADRYAHACYDLVGVADVNSDRESTFAWDAQAAVYTPKSTFLVYTFRRKSDSPCIA